MEELVAEAQRWASERGERRLTEQNRPTATEADFVRHHTDGLSVEDLAKRYPGSAESHIMLHRKLDIINDRLIELRQHLKID